MPEMPVLDSTTHDEVPYRFADHARHLDARFDALDLDRGVLVRPDVPDRVRRPA